MKRNLLLLTTILISSSCSWFESDYDKLMNPIKEIKLAEKKAGKPNPAYDGVVEPDFPDVKLNNETLEGVDANRDGVRDDVEIWINRVAEDEYVRWAMKDYYRKSLIMYKAFQENQTEPVIHKAEADLSDAIFCWSAVSREYDDYFVKKHKKDPREKDNNKIILIINNNLLRKKLDDLMERFQINGLLGGNGDSYCSNSHIGKRYLKLKQKI